MIGSGCGAVSLRFFREVPLPAGTQVEKRDRQDGGIQRRKGRSRATCSGSATPTSPRPSRSYGAPGSMSRGVPCIAIRVSFTGDLGWELRARRAIGRGSTRRFSGPGGTSARGRSASRALLALRIEKRVRQLGPRLLTRILAPGTRARRFDQNRQAVPQQGCMAGDRRQPPRERLVMLEIEANAARCHRQRACFRPRGRGVGNAAFPPGPMATMSKSRSLSPSWPPRRSCPARSSTSPSWAARIAPGCSTGRLSSIRTGRAFALTRPGSVP